MMMFITSFLFLVISPLTFAKIEKEQFYQIPQDILKVMSSDIERSGLEVSLKLDWDSHTVNAGANRKGNKGTLLFYGGYARLAPMTNRSFANTVCHELGHLIATGIKTMPTNKYASEAQSDFFATNVCLKKYSKISMKYNKLNNFHKSLCQNKYSKKEELDLCAGLMQASVDKLKVENSIDPSGSWDNLNLLDKSKAKFTNYNGYPDIGCRYTTSIHGALNLARPGCWFNANSPILSQSYIPSYEYSEAMFIGTVGKVVHTYYGCDFSIVDISYFQGSYFSSIEEDELMDKFIRNVGKCRIEDGGSISGPITLYEGEFYLNLEMKDK
jgi:hypothetical protein